MNTDRTPRSNVRARSREGGVARPGRVLACVALACVAGSARAQLQPDQVLVVYDSRIASSRDVAEYYAGSGKVPGGPLGNAPGVHPTVRVFDLASTGLATLPAGNVDYSVFRDRMRDPIREYLLGEGIERRVRCIVLTKGLPHRLRDTDNANVGDSPSNQGAEFTAGDCTNAAVDSELTLLWQNLDAGEAGGQGDSLADGVITNPYWKSDRPINAFSTQYMATSKTFASSGLGQIWFVPTTATGPDRLTPGDIVLVTRLDGKTVDDVKAVIDRGAGRIIALGSYVFDESNSNGAENTAPNSELDNQGNNLTRSGDDYERAANLLAQDPRVGPFSVVYDAAAGASNFCVGPLVDFGGGRIVSSQVLLLASYGSNHDGRPTGAGIAYAESFNYAPGAVFNTIESYNGRAFGGLGTALSQEQLTDFLSAGGTFGIGHVWEPFANFVPDNEFIAQNFFLGGLTWAEAAWTSIPVLSWQHIVLGDPLGRVARFFEDVNGDGKVDIDDMYAWAQNPTDTNGDFVVNDEDGAHLERVIRRYERDDMRAPNVRAIGRNEP
ncbi:MAG: hypothetical protein RBS39_12205 [Phycisphaerales bacterium]|jgi:hypothetical protein|nr:hypothetical protein [Phycisphaerales bacterium]